MCICQRAGCKKLGTHFDWDKKESICADHAKEKQMKSQQKGK